MPDKAYIIVYGVRTSNTHNQLDSCTISENLYAQIDDVRREALHGIAKFLGNAPFNPAWQRDTEGNEITEFPIEGDKIGRCEIRRLPIQSPTQ